MGTRRSRTTAIGAALFVLSCSTMNEVQGTDSAQGEGASTGGGTLADDRTAPAGSGGQPVGNGGDALAEAGAAPAGGGGLPGGGNAGLGAAGSGGNVEAPVASGEPPAGNPDGACAVPEEAGPADSARPDHVVGSGSAASCTGDAFIAAVAQGGVITFDCGPAPIVITLTRPAKVFNDATPDIVIDGGGKVTLSGGGRSRILYMNTCDPAQHWTTSHCDNQDHPRLTVQNLTFRGGDASADHEYGGGGALWVRGGRLRVVNCRFFNNNCAAEGPDVGGAGIRALNQYDALPIYVVHSTFGGAEGYGNRCANGGGISSIGVNWIVLNSVFSHNQATGFGGNPADPGTPGGGSGGAIYSDGRTLSLSLCGTRIEHNRVRAYGSGIFFVSNTHDGTLRIRDSILRDNTGGDWNVQPGISMHEDTRIEITNSTIE